jgi:hypothetical protein
MFYKTRREDIMVLDFRFLTADIQRQQELARTRRSGQVAGSAPDKFVVE